MPLVDELRCTLEGDKHRCKAVAGGNIIHEDIFNYVDVPDTDKIEWRLGTKEWIVKTPGVECEILEEEGMKLLRCAIGDPRGRRYSKGKPGVE